MVSEECRAWNLGLKCRGAWSSGLSALGFRGWEPRALRPKPGITQLCNVNMGMHGPEAQDFQNTYLEMLPGGRVLAKSCWGKLNTPGPPGKEGPKRSAR